MAFSYQFGANPPIDLPRLLIADTVALNHIFEDSEIQLATLAQTLQYQSGMFWSGSLGRNLPTAPVAYLRIAAMLLDCIASNKARLSSISRILDINLNTGVSAQALRDQANQWRDVDDNSGAIMIIEQCNDVFSYRDRFWKQVQRQSAGNV